MRCKNIKILLVGLLFFTAIAGIKPVFANIPDVEGRVLTNGTNAPVGNVWVKMTMSGCPWTSVPRNKLLPQSRYTKTDSNGYYIFEALTESEVAQQTNKPIDTDFDGVNDDIQFPTYDACYESPGIDPPNMLIWLFGCGRDPYLISVVKPYNWNGQFTSTGELSLLNDCPVGYCISNDYPASPVPTLYWKGNAVAPTRTPTPTPSPTRTPTPTPTRTPTPLPGTPTPTNTPTPTRTPTPTITPGGPTLTPTRAPTATPTLAPGQCWGVQHCATDNNSTIYFEYCGDCSVPGCDPGFTCRDASMTCRTYITPPISYDTPYPLPCVRLTITPTPTEAPTHLSCTGISCQAVSGAGPDSCLPEGDSCQQTTTGCPATCGDFGTVTQSCSCSGPCCPGTCRNGLSCGETKSVACCNSRSPTFPSNVSINQPGGGAIIQTRTVKIDWTFANTVGCGNAWGFNCSGNTNLSFKIVIDDDQYFYSPLITKTGIPSTARTYTTTAADGYIKDNKKYYVKVCAVNYKETCTIVSFTKQAYPVGIVIGSVGEFDTLSSQPFSNNGASGSISFNAAPPITTGITTTCSKTTGGTPPATQSYNCNISLDNINFDPIPNQTYTVTASGYNSSMYTGVCSQNGVNCTQPVAIAINFDANAGTPPNITHNIYFSMNSSLAFFKIKNGSIQTHNSAAWSAYFPVTILPFDSQDYTAGGNFLIIGDTAASYNAVGTALFTSPISLGTALTSQKTAPYPPGKNWMSEGYLPVTAFNAQRYIEYVKTRKQYQTITELKDLKSGIINVWNGDLVIDKNNSNQRGQNNFNAKDIVLVVTGSVSFNTDSFTPNGGASTAIVADTINFFSGAQYVQEAQGVFIGNSINFGSSNIPIKITGNVASTQNSIALSRVRDDHRIPSVFVVYDITPYVDLLPQLSTALYEWKQLQ